MAQVAIVSKYGHLALGRKVAVGVLNGADSCEVINTIKANLDRDMVRRGREIFGLVSGYTKYQLPKIMMGEALLGRLEEASQPHGVISVEEIRAFIEAFKAHDKSATNAFQRKHELTLLDLFHPARPDSGRLMILSGPSAVGKGTIQDDYLLPQGLPKSPLDNIRNRRPGELNGVTYYFIDGPDIPTRCQTLVQMKREGHFIATALVHEKTLVNPDGTLKIPGARSQGVGKNLFDLVEQPEKGMKTGRDLLVEVDLKLAAQIITRARQKRLQLNYVFLLPSSFDDLIGRIIGRTLKEAGGDPAKLEIKKIEERLENGIGEMAFSFLLHPTYVINHEGRAEQAARDVAQAFGFKPRVSAVVGNSTKEKVSGRVTIDAYDKAIQAAREEGLELLPPNYPIVRAVPGEAAEPLRSKIDKMTDHGNKRATVPALLDVMRDPEFRALVWRAVGCPNLPALVNQIHPGLPQRYTMAIQPGTLAPYHFGHISFAQGAILDGGLAGSVVLSGSDPPEKKFVVSAAHRESMVGLGLIGYPYLHYSPIRVQMMDILSSVPLGGPENKRLIEAAKKIRASESAEEKVKLQKAMDEERRLRDLAAFSFLISLNPHLKWEYIVGVDKVNGYGISGKDERELALDLLLDNNIPIRYYTREGEKLELFERDTAYVNLHRSATSWALENRPFIESRLLEGATTSFDISATTVRGMIKGREPLLDALPSGIIGYILDSGLIRAYELEDRAKALKKRLESGTGENDAQVELNEINDERKTLFSAGILANGEPLTLDDIRIIK